MKNYESLFAAYLVAWAIFFVYEISVARRLAALREEMERVSKALGCNSKSESSRQT